MNLPKLEIIEGDVAKVQRTSETHVAARQGVRPADKPLASSRVVNFMRIFLTGADGEERDFQFANSTVAVNQGERVAIVRAKPRGPGPWLTLALYNLTTQKREEQIGAFAKAVRQQWMGARWRAALWAGGVAGLYWLVSEAFHFPERQRGLGLAASIAILVYVAAWAIGSLIDRFVVPARQREAERALRFAVDERMSAAKQERAPPKLPAPQDGDKDKPS